MFSIVSVSHKTTAFYFLRVVSSCYMMAFVSLYPQIRGLYGPRGVMPVENSLFNDNQDQSAASPLNGLDLKAMLASVRGLGIRQAMSLAGVSPVLAMELVAIVGAAVATFITVFPMQV